MNIKMVKLVESGSSGLLVTFTKDEERGQFNVKNDYPNVRFRAPVNEELKKEVKKLRKYALDILQLDGSIAKDDLEITGISGDGATKFVITAKVRTFGKKIYGVSTPCMEDKDDYAEFDTVIRISQKIFDETAAYIEQRKIATPKQIVLDFEKDNPEFNVKEFNAMDEKDQIQRAMEILEKKGAVVLMPEDQATETEGDATESFGGDDGEKKQETTETPVIPITSKSNDETAEFPQRDVANN